jgi:hypothetical protein
MRSIYPENGRFNKAAIILASMSPDMVEDIIALVNAKGRSILTDVYAVSSGPSVKGVSQPRFLAIFSNEFIAEEDFEDTFLGFSTVALSSLRKPNYGKDEYEVILTQAYNLPSKIAQNMADRIETYDPVGTGQEGWFSKAYINISETLRKLVNYVPSVLRLPWENDQDQKYDFDFLFEMKSLGVVVRELNSRARLMVGQAMINTSYGLLQAGDVNDETGDAEVASALANVNRRQLPHSIMGGMKPLGEFGNHTSYKQAKQMVEAAGYHKGQNGDVEQGEVKNDAIARSLESLGDVSVGKAGLLGLALGLTPTIIKKIKEMMSKDEGSGDPNENSGLYSDLATKYGQGLANHWMTGDVDGLMGEIGDIASMDLTTGDPDLDAQIAGDVEDELGDLAESMGPEIGGLLKRFRTNVNIGRANAKHRRGDKKTQRGQRREFENQQLIGSKNERMRQGYKKLAYNPTSYNVPESDNNLDMGGGMNEGYEDQEQDYEGQNSGNPGAVDSFYLA